MNFGKRKCPYCGEKIDAAAEKCSFCGENIEVRQQNFSKNLSSAFEKIKEFKLKKSDLKKQLIILLIPVFLIAGVLAAYIIENNSTKDIFGNFNLSEIEEPIDILGAMTNDENIAKNYLNKIHLQKNKDKVFQTFLNRLAKENEKYNELMDWFEFFDDRYDYEYKDLMNGHPVVVKRIELTSKRTKKDDMELVSIHITSPKAPLIKYVYIGEGAFETVIDYCYLNENYSKLLGNFYKDFLNIKAKEENDLNGGGYYQDGAVGVSKKVLVEWILALQKLRSKYPKIVADNMQIERDINIYTADLMTDTYQTFDFMSEKMYPECKKAYEDFLNSANKDTQEYKAVKEAYDVLEKYDFKYNNEFSSVVKSYSIEKQ